MLKVYLHREFAALSSWLKYGEFVEFMVKYRKFFEYSELNCEFDLRHFEVWHTSTSLPDLYFESSFVIQEIL